MDAQFSSGAISEWPTHTYFTVVNCLHKRSLFSFYIFILFVLLELSESAAALLEQKVNDFKMSMSGCGHVKLENNKYDSVGSIIWNLISHPYLLESSAVNEWYAIW